ncbi:uncharacterized protein J4E88_007176 [Alternaria novae-zelandiae]|uniref:uncharacterized protein n=1 Tax=Alternaria novae-zelandiae TaxID=430562 RepID=UPI0020C4C243|nr:uncharacterized protein J4E88_007176 [Alternaria novae-zelandiae]KAI4677368.1 hypothetical protein J4E88_007176 [Alternaria novae-zelandiae]
MPAFNVECVEDAPNATGPIIEDITEFCDFCVVLMEFILEDSKPGTKALRTILSSPPETSSESCRFCEMISSVRGSTRTELVESYEKKDWYPGYNTGEDWEDQRRHRQYEFAFGDVDFAVWADKAQHLDPSSAVLPFLTPL